MNHHTSQAQGPTVSQSELAPGQLSEERIPGDVRKSLVAEVAENLAFIETTIMPNLSDIEKRMYGRMTRLIKGAGGTIEDNLFVTRPGVMTLLEAPALTPTARSLFDSLHIDGHEPDYAQLVHFKTAITNMTFPDVGKDTADFIDQVVGKSGHRSVTNDIKPVFLLAGVSLETSFELTAHHEADVGRLTSSATSAMNFPLYEISGNAWERLVQKREILAHIIRERDADACIDRRLLSKDGKEYTNRLHPGCKVTTLTYSMGLKDFHKLFIGRFAPTGNERGVQDVCHRMCEQLHSTYPLVINKPEWYATQGNAKKYE